MSIVLIFLQVIFYVLAINAGYIFILSIAGLFAKTKRTAFNPIKGKFAVLIPAYKYDDLILESAPAALKQQYPEYLFDVFVIADQLQPQTIVNLQSQGIHVFEVHFEKSTKAKSLNFAMSEIPEHRYDYALILDIDNLMEPGLLEKLNSYHQKGFKAVQAHRTTKNLNTNFAILDAISEEINNHVHRRAHRVLGLASILIGSAMSFDFMYLKKLMQSVESSVEDKEIEMAILKDKVDIAYIDDALVYDEKVAKPEVFANQRIRWVYSQFYALKLHFKDGMLSLFNKNWSYFFKVFELMLIPKVMLLGFIIIFLAFSFILGLNGLGLLFLWLLIIYGIALAVSVPKRFITASTLKAVISIPQAFILMTATLFKLERAKKSFIPTHHEKADK